MTLAIRRVLISVTDKTGIAEFARALAGLGAGVISTGGTAALLRSSGVPVIEVSEVTGFPEMLDGRVKTLHPKIAGGILAVRENPEHQAALARHGIEPIDMVVVNLYRFEEAAARAGASEAELIENIDIGGPSLIRAAAKNYASVAAVVSPADYDAVIAEMRAGGGSLSLDTRRRLALKAFATTAAYDCAISARLSPQPAAFDRLLEIRAAKLADLRYGENPHQRAALYGAAGAGVAGARQLQGKELSYNNLVDLDAAWQLVAEFRRPAAAIIKHTNPCGCGEQATLAEAYRKAFACDPVSAFGGVVGFNRPLDEETARELTQTFVEAVAAPDYSPAALELLGAKRNLRALRVAGGMDPVVLRSISGGYLVQSADALEPERGAWLVKTRRAPGDEEWAALEFAWKVAKHVKSNAIVYARAGATAAIGAGQMSRVDAVRLGAMKAVLPLAGTVLASDAFFPFPDGVEEAAKHGVTAFVQPGGSVRDQEVVAAAERLGAAMVFTGVRHFRH